MSPRFLPWPPPPCRQPRRGQRALRRWDLASNSVPAPGEQGAPLSARRGARPQRCGILSLLLHAHVSVFISRRTFHRRLAALGVSSLFNLMKIEKFKTICPCPSQQPEHHGSQRRLKGTRVQGVGGARYPVPREQSHTYHVSLSSDCWFSQRNTLWGGFRGKQTHT